MAFFIARILPALLVQALFISSCAGRHFHDAGPPPAQPVQLRLDEWPCNEFWTGIVFNGSKIGFTHFALAPAENARAGFEVRSEAFLSFSFLFMKKTVALKSRDIIGPDLSLKSFVYEYNLDGNRLTLSGEVGDNRLSFDMTAGEETSSRTITFDGPLYPASAITLYPLYHGLGLGRSYRFAVFNGETQKISTVQQEIQGYETSTMFSGAAYKVATLMHGQNVLTWIDRQGMPVLEMTRGGVLIAHIEAEHRAKEYIAEAAVSKNDAFLEFSSILPDRHIPCPRGVTDMAVELSGVPGSFTLPATRLQQCRREGETVRCRVSAADTALPTHAGTSVPAPRRYLLPSFAIPSTSPRIARTARDIAGAETDPLRLTEQIVNWIDRHIEKTPADVFTAIDVLDTKQAECQGHSLLFAALGRALGIPVRITNGIVYSEVFRCFLFHTWAEAYLSCRWIPVDPTFGQIPADATHIKLLDGEQMAELIPLTDLIGRLSLEVISFEPSEPSVCR